MPATAVSGQRPTGGGHDGSAVPAAPRKAVA